MTGEKVSLPETMTQGEKILGGDLKQFLEEVRSRYALLEEDRPLETELRQFTALIQEAHWPLYEETK